MLRLLVADDNPITLQFLTSALRQLGWQAVAVSDGAAAARCAATDRFDVLLFDARMPILDGASALRKIRAEPGQSTRSPALATTASTDRDTHDTLMAAGFDAVLPKPISLADLGAAVRRYERKGNDTITPFFDDARAHAVVGGDSSIVTALRRLLLAELERLPGELAIMSRQLNASQQLDQRLHKLAASAGFCGAVGLEDAVRALEAARNRQADWAEHDVASFTTRCEEIAGRLRREVDGASDF